MKSLNIPHGRPDEIKSESSCTSPPGHKSRPNKKAPKPTDDRESSGSRSPPKPRLPTFGGDKSMKVETFLFQFSRVAKRRGWGSPKKANSLVDLLVGDALDYAKRLDDSVLSNFGTLKRCLTERFSTKLNPKTARKELTLARQLEDESLDDYAQRLVNLAQDAYCDLSQSDLSQVTVECFLRGLTDKAAAMYVLGEDPQSVRGALRAVKEYQANNRAIYGQTTKPLKQRNVTFSGESDLDVKLKQTLDSYFQSRPDLPGIRPKRTNFKPESPNYFDHSPQYPRSTQLGSRQDHYAPRSPRDDRSRSHDYIYSRPQYNPRPQQYDNRARSPLPNQSQGYQRSERGSVSRSFDRSYGRSPSYERP
ncbi:MAG: hypothetical protein ABW185_29455, partial [Sedimenticola sp.]